MIGKCPHVCENKSASGYCKTTACINPRYSNIGTAQYGQGVQKRIVANADRVRAMDDEKLAMQLAMPYVTYPPWCSENIECPYLNQDPTPCDECALEWLRQEAAE